MHGSAAGWHTSDAGARSGSRPKPRELKAAIVLRGSSTDKCVSSVLTNRSLEVRAVDVHGTDLEDNRPPLPGHDLPGASGLPGKDPGTDISSNPLHGPVPVDRRWSNGEKGWGQAGSAGTSPWRFARLHRWAVHGVNGIAARSTGYPTPVPARIRSAWRASEVGRVTHHDPGLMMVSRLRQRSLRRVLK
jgi:hypothetical protein